MRQSSETEDMCVNSIEEALDQLGVTESSLSAEQKRALDEQGYLLLRSVIESRLLEKLRAAFEQAAGQDRQSKSTGSRKETGTRHPSDLLNRDPIFAAVCEQPAVLAAIYHILGRAFRLSQLGGRDPLPGYGQQGLHADWMARTPKEPFYVVTAIWMLDDFTRDNGATRIVPGTHKQPGQPPKSMADPAGRHPNELIVTAPAGSVLVFNGHLWHSGTRNNSQRSRRALQSVFWARENFPPYTQPLCDRPESLSPAVRYILGV